MNAAHWPRPTVRFIHQPNLPNVWQKGSHRKRPVVAINDFVRA
jgi:hypothetical protein